MEALLNTSTMEQATEYLLTHPPPLLGGAVRVSLNKQIRTLLFFVTSLNQTDTSDIFAALSSRT